MRWMLAVAVVLNSFAAYAGFAGSGLTGNDTGGVIQWTPDIDLTYRDIAAAHCARWNRLAGITSVHRTYGNYIGFQCIYDRRFDPRRGGAFLGTIRAAWDRGRRLGDSETHPTGNFEEPMQDLFRRNRPLREG